MKRAIAVVTVVLLLAAGCAPAVATSSVAPTTPPSEGLSSTSKLYDKDGIVIEGKGFEDRALYPVLKFQIRNHTDEEVVVSLKGVEYNGKPGGTELRVDVGVGETSDDGRIVFTREGKEKPKEAIVVFGIKIGDAPEEITPEIKVKA